MSFNIDGFNERNNYIRNCNDLNKIRKNNNKLNNPILKTQLIDKCKYVKNLNTNSNVINNGIGLIKKININNIHSIYNK